jgi:hypothetical protein
MVRNQGIETQSGKQIKPHKSNFTFQVSIKWVYENAHRVSEDVTLQYGESMSMNKIMENHPCLNHSKQKTEIIKYHVLHPKASFLHMTRERERERERDVQVLDYKGLVNKYLGTQDLDTTQMYSTYHEG